MTFFKIMTFLYLQSIINLFNFQITPIRVQHINSFSIHKKIQICLSSQRNFTSVDCLICKSYCQENIMGHIVSYCNCSKQTPIRILSRISRVKHNPNDQNLTTKKLLFHQIADLFPYKYLGKGLYGTTLEVFSKSNKTQKFAQKIVPQQNLNEEYICYDPQMVDRIMLDPDLKHKIVKVYAYSINDQKRKMYLIMDLMKKSDLYFHLCRLQKKNGRLYPQKAIKRIAVELLQIVEKFHSYNVIFRNLRTENVYLKQNGNLAVSDFFFALKGTKSHSYYGAAQYAPPEVYYLQKTVKTMNEGAWRNLNEISDNTEEKQLRMSPEVRRFNLNTTQHSLFKPTRSCDLKNELKNLKLERKQHESYKQKSNELLFIEMRRKQSKQSLQLSKEDHFHRKNSRNMTTLNFVNQNSQQRKQQKHMTSIIPQQPFGENSQVKQDTIRVGPGFFRLQYGVQQDEKDEIDSNISASGKEYDQTIDFWMLGVLLYELIFGRTPFQKWKGTCDILSKTPACPSYAENLIDLQYQVKNKEISQIWPLYNQQNNQPIVSGLEMNFIENLLIRERSQRKQLKELRSHPFLKDCDMKTPIQELIYDQKFEPNSLERDVRFEAKNKVGGFVVSRTILRKTFKTTPVKSRVTQKLFEHEKSVIDA